MKKIYMTLAAAVIFAAGASGQSTNPAPYCSATFDDAGGFPVADAINIVNVGTLNNFSGAQYAAPHYVYYNNLTAPNLLKGSTVQMALEFNVLGGAGYGVWIDYNHNNVFSATELVAGTFGTTSLTLGSNVPQVATFPISPGATVGVTRMRVRIVEDDAYHAAHGFDESPCNASTSAADVMDWGETEDYDVNITSSTTGTTEIEAPSVAVYPNPASLFVNIDAVGYDQISYKIFNSVGALAQAGDNAGLVSIEQLNDGIYLLEIYHRDELIGREKLVKR